VSRDIDIQLDDDGGRFVLTEEGDTVDLVCWKAYPDPNAALDTVLRANPHISRSGPKLAAGTRINLPRLDHVTVPTVKRVLW